MHTKPGQKDPSIFVKFVSAGLAASVAEAVTIPIDTAKVRLQVRGFFLPQILGSLIESNFVYVCSGVLKLLFVVCNYKRLLVNCLE